MATKKITDLTNVTSVQDTDLLLVETSEGTRSVSKENLFSGTISYDALPITGGTLTGDLNIQHSDKTESKVRVVNSLHDGNFTTSVNGNLGIYDNTFTKWIVRSTADGTVSFFGTAEKADVATTANSANNADKVDGYHITTSTTDLTAGSSPLTTNTLYFVYE